MRTFRMISGKGAHSIARASRGRGRLFACLAAAALAVSWTVCGTPIFAAQAAGGQVLRDVTTGTGYEDVSSGWEAATAGDTLELLADVELDEPLSLGHDLTLDLNGHELTLDATLEKGAASDAEADGISLASGATLTVTDGSNKKTGALSIEVGSKNETRKGGVYQGIDVTDDAALVLDGADLSVTYAGASIALPAIELHGVSLETGSFRAAGDSTLSVKAAPQDRAYGAQDAMGIWASADSKGVVSVGENARVEVDNNATPLYSDVADYPDKAGGASSQKDSNARLVEVKVAAGSELDEQVQEAFRKEAKFDSTSDSDGNVYGASIYYATALDLENGMTVWAYSDQVSEDEAGKLSNIRADHVFFRAACADPVNAYGVYAESGFGGSVEVTGALKASTGEGNAVGACAAGSAADWKVNEGTVEVSCSEAPYMVAGKAKFDLRDYLEIQGFDDQAVSYPKNNYLKEAQAVQPQAIKVASGAIDEQAGTITDANLHAALFSAMDGDVQVTFAGLHDSNGGARDDVVQTVAYGQTLKEAGAKQVSSESYVQDGTRHCFVGWKLSGDSSVYAHDADAVYASTPLTSSVSGATSGFVTYTAQYCEVPSGEHLVTFRLEDELFAYAVEDGATPSYASARGLSLLGRDTVEPEKVTTRDGYGYDFAGWVAGLDGESILQDGDSPLEEIPAATEDAGYTARFSEEVAGVLVTIRYKALVDGVFTDLRKVVPSVSWQSSALEALDEYAVLGETTSWRGLNYTLVGWSPRESDKEALYTGDFCLEPQASSLVGTGVKLYGLYETTDQYVNVTFHSGGAVVGQTVSVPANTTVKNALSAAGVAESDLTPPADDQELRGWDTSEDSATVMASSITRVGAACDYADSVDFYAIWGIKQYLVTFYDSDKTTRLGAFYVDTGSTVMDSNSDFEITLTGVKFDTFEGWYTASGEKFDPGDTVVTADTDVYAKYKTYATGTGTVSKSSGASGGVAAPSLTASTGVVSGVSAAKAVTAGKAATAAASGADDAAATQVSTATDDASGSTDNVGTGDEGTLASRIALGVVLAVFVALAGLVFLWFKRRRASDDDVEAVDAGPVGAERIHF